MGAQPVVGGAPAAPAALRLVELDAVTLDANGTLVTLADPVPELQALLAERGVARERPLIERALTTEYAYYRAHAHEGGDSASLVRLRRDCAAVFLAAVHADLDADELGPHYNDALRFELLPGVRESLESLRSHGLALAVVSNWDCSLPDHLGRLEVAHLFSVVVTAGDIGAAKPDARPLEAALQRLGVLAARTLHIGDGDDDALAAATVGAHFARPPVRDVVRSLA